MAIAIIAITSCSPLCIIVFTNMHNMFMIVHFNLCTAPVATRMFGRQNDEANYHSSLLYLLIGAAVAMVLIVAVIVLLLGVIAWKR